MSITKKRASIEIVMFICTIIFWRATSFRVHACGPLNKLCWLNTMGDCSRLLSILAGDITPHCCRIKNKWPFLIFDFWGSFFSEVNLFMYSSTNWAWCTIDSVIVIYDLVEFCFWIHLFVSPYEDIRVHYQKPNASSFCVCDCNYMQLKILKLCWCPACSPYTLAYAPALEDTWRYLGGNYLFMVNSTHDILAFIFRRCHYH